MDIPDAARTARCSAVDVVGLLLDRRLARVRRAPDLTGYMSVLVDPNEIRPLVHRDFGEGLTMKEVELTTKWSGRVIRALVENGHLPSRDVQNPINHLIQTRVTKEDLDRFTGEYVSLHGLADELGRHFRRLKWEIEDAGVRPAFDPAQVWSTFYRRADLPPL